MHVGISHFFRIAHRKRDNLKKVESRDSGEKSAVSICPTEPILSKRAESTTGELQVASG